MKRIILLVLWILNSFLLSSQTSSNFNYAVEASICNGNTGNLSIAATSIGLDGFPLPWYIEIENQQNNDYKDYVMEFSEASIAELAPGMYSVIIWMDDLSGCYETFYVNIPNNNQLEISADIHHLCFIDIYDGQIDLDIGEGIFQVDWYVLLPPWSPIPQVLLQSHTGVTNGSGAEDLTGIPVGRYNVHVIDSRGCYQEATYEVLDQSIHIALPDTIIVCAPGTGEIIPDVSGGLGIYEYLWSSGDTGEELYGLDAGIYTVTVTDEGGCSGVASVEVVESASNIDILISKIEDCGNGTGSIYISVHGGIAPYDIRWSNGSTNYNISDLNAGNYTVTVTDKNGCSREENIVIESTGLRIVIERTSCHTLRTKEFYGHPPYSYKWNNGEEVAEIVADTKGIYAVTVTDAKGCVKTANTNYSKEDWILTNAEIINDVCDLGYGSINLNLNRACEIHWLSPVNKTDIGYHSTIENLQTGLYIVELNPVGDQGCKIYKSFIIENEKAFNNVFYTYRGPALCNYYGKIQVGVRETYNIPTNLIKYKWSTGSTNSEINHLPSGDYTVTVTINDKCTFESSVSIQELSGSMSKINPNCGQSNGSISWQNPEKELDNFSILWNTGHTTTSVTGLPAGLYTVTVSESGCTRVFETTLTEENKLEDYGASIARTCENNEVTYTISDYGSLPDDILINWAYEESDKNPVISNMESITFRHPENTGRLSLKIFDENCLISEGRLEKGKINQMDILPPLDCGGANLPGRISVSYQGHLGYLWSTGATTNTTEISTGGIYTVTITDDKCENSVTSVVQHSGEFELYTVALKNPDSYCEGNGYIKVGSNLDKYPVRYKWDNINRSNEISNVGTGLYSVTATLGPCEKVLTYDLCSCTSCEEEFWPNFEFYPATCDFSSDITVLSALPSGIDTYDGWLSAGGLSSNYAVSWYHMNTKGEYEWMSASLSIKFLHAGIYKLKWSDGCNEYEKVIKLFPLIPCINSTFSLQLMNEPCKNGSIIIKPLNASGYVYYEINTGFSKISLPNEFISIPVNNHQHIVITAYDLQTNCSTVLEIDINKTSKGNFYVEIPLRNITSCINGKGYAIGEVRGGIKLLSRWLLNGKVVSNSDYLTYSEGGIYTFEAYNTCGVKASKSITLSCNCDNSKFPAILQYSSCFDECDFFEKLDVGGCSKLKVAVNCEANGIFDISWPNNSITKIKNCDIQSGNRYYYPTIPGDNLPVVIKSETGCIQNLYFTFNQPWCGTGYLYHPLFPVIYGTQDYKGACGEPVQYNTPVNQNKFTYLPNGFGNPCAKGIIRSQSSCKNIPPIEVDLSSSTNKLEFQGTQEIPGTNCILCMYQDSEAKLFDGKIFGVEYCPDKYCPEVSLTPNPIDCETPVTVIIKNNNANFDFTGKMYFNVQHEEFISIPRHSTKEFLIQPPKKSGIHTLYVIFDNTSCENPKLEKRLIVIDCPPGINEDCETDYINLIVNSDQKSFNTYWYEDNEIQGAKFSRESGSLGGQEYFYVASSNNKPKMIRQDSSGCHVLLDNSGKHIRKIDNTGTEVWVCDLVGFEVKNIGNDITNEINVIGWDSLNLSYSIWSINTLGEINTKTLLPFIPFAHNILDHNEQYVVSADNGTHSLMLVNNTGTIESPIPMGITVKDIKTTKDGKIIVAGEFTGIISAGGKIIDSGGYKNAIFLQYDQSGDIKLAKAVQNFRDELLYGITILGTTEVLYYGKYIDSNIDTISNVVDSCSFIHIITIDTTICTTFVSELTMDRELCQLTWLPLPEDYISTLEYLSADSIWTTAQLIEGQDGFASPYYVTDDGIYRLVHRKIECPDVVSNEINTSCHPISCPEIVRAYDEDDEEYECYSFQIRHGENKEFRFIIRTWVYDTMALQFTDTVSFIITDTSQIFSYCDLPDQYGCYNYGDIRILCDRCDSSCMQYYVSWSCIPRTSTDESISDVYVNVRYYPNPFAGGVYLQYHSKASQRVAMSVYNSTGLLVLRKDIVIKEGGNLEYIKEIETLQPDVYTIQLKGESLINTSKVVKIR